jgi:hypothetical protein
MIGETEEYLQFPVSVPEGKGTLFARWGKHKMPGQDYERMREYGKTT